MIRKRINDDQEEQDDCLNIGYDMNTLQDVKMTMILLLLFFLLFLLVLLLRMEVFGGY